MTTLFEMTTPPPCGAIDAAAWAAPEESERALAIPTIKDLPAAERPRERLLTEGEQTLADSELLGLIIGSGLRGATAVDLGKRLLARFGGLRGLAGPQASELARLSGIGPARAARLRACLEIARRFAAAPLEPGAKIGGPSQLFEHFGPLLRDVKRERFYLVLLDRRNRVIRAVMVAEGTLSETVVHPREAFAAAVRESAAAVIAIHNHPSGDPAPSQADIAITARLQSCGEILGIKLLDHVIIGATSFRSLRDEGLLRGGP